MRRAFAATLALLLIACPALAAEVVGRIVGLADGDTLTVLTPSQEQLRVRLSDIDAPESGQPYGTRARQVLGGLVARRAVRVVAQDTDRYGRTVGRVYVGSVDVSAEMVRRGAAWVFRRYSQDPQLLALEAEAQAARRGLWALPETERVPPWEWRASGREAATPAPREQVPAPRPTRPAPFASSLSAPSAGGGFSCGGKQYCREMTSCAEARYYLSQCGLSRLDRDRDGVPCETLCR